MYFDFECGASLLMVTTMMLRLLEKELGKIEIGQIRFFSLFEYDKHEHEHEPYDEINRMHATLYIGKLATIILHFKIKIFGMLSSGA